jgi:ATPase family associated with various cellular activities (AAA)
MTVPPSVHNFAHSSQITSQAAGGIVRLQAEAQIRAESQASLEEVCAAVEGWLRTLPRIPTSNGPLPLDQGQGNPFLDAHCDSISLVDVEYSIGNGSSKSFFLPWEVIWDVRAYALDANGAEDGDDGDDDCPSFRQYTLPSTDFHGLWESLYYDSEVKRRLLRYADSALLFGQLGVDNTLITSGRLVLLHGPPGTGKTSLCKALAQKLSIRLNKYYTTAELVEVNAHSLFSRWFSESGKLVAKLFEAIKEKLEEPDALVFVLVDEVESLAAARGAAAGSGEPSDAIRAVNALLTQIDQLRTHPNCMILTTSNLTGNIDVAFVDRADIKAYIGPPTVKSRYEMLRSSLQELVKVGIIHFERHGAHFPRLDGLPTAALDAANAAGIAALALGDNAKNTHNHNSGDFAMDSSSEVNIVNNNNTSSGSIKTEQEESILLGLKLCKVAENAEGLSGRALRKLPFLAHASAGFPGGRATAKQFLDAMDIALQEEKSDRQALVQY